ncbi:MAG: hypothetical protein ACRC6M_17150 [Microcystaceae cyanobacterium]
MKILITLFLTCLFSLMTLAIAPTAWALSEIPLTEISYRDCPSEIAEGSVLSGSNEAANCFLVTGVATNKTGKTVYDADVFGRIYDANNEPAMQNRNRVGAIAEIPPGQSNFEIRISVAANQPTPLRLAQFRARGFTGKVRKY